MDVVNSCEVCGGNETKLVDGFYYCVECGTRDADVQERVVEHTLLAIGNQAFSDKRKLKVKIADVVEMSSEWYKWHAYNFILAGLTERLVQLGAEPGFKMKVLWVWARYMDKYLNKEQFGRTQEVHKIRDMSESEEEPVAPQEQEERETTRFSVSRVSKLLFLSILGAALNLERSAVGMARLRRLVRHRLLPLNAPALLLPDDFDTRKVEGFWRLVRSRNQGCRLGFALGRLRGRLRLGAWRTPRLELALQALLRDLCLPRELARLVRALIWFAPVPYSAHKTTKRAGAEPAYPEYESTVAAYVLVALKLCFGLDDHHELRLSDEVERINNVEGRPRAYLGESGGSEGETRLFSYRQWMRHVRFQRLVLADACAPLAHERNERAGDCAAVEQCDEPAAAARDWTKKGCKGEAVQLRDQVTMDIIDKIPLRPPETVPAAVLAPCLAAPAPHAALTAALAPQLPPHAAMLIKEDFTEYSVAYAYKPLSLPSETGENLVGGVDAAGKSFVPRLGDEFARRHDPDVVYVRNCENENWARTRRPRPFHVVETEEAPPEPDDLGDRRDPDDADDEADVELETFEEEAEGVNIFDDDFLDLENNEENDSIRDEREDTEDPTLNDFKLPDNFNIEYPEDAAAGGHDDSDRDSDDSDDSHDSDDSDEPAPRYDPASFDRLETIKAIMTAAYDQMKIRQPARFRVQFRKSYRKTRRDLAPGAAVPRDKPKNWETKKARDERAMRVREILAAYQDNSQRDESHQVSRDVPHQVPRDVPHQVSRDVPHQEPRDGSHQVPRDVPHQVSRDVPHQVSRDVPHQVSRDVPHQVSQQVRAGIDRPVDGEPGVDEPVDAPSRADTLEISSTGTRGVEIVDNADKSDEESEGPAEDPVYRGDVRFDASTHDASQLYVKLAAPPAADDRDDDDDDDDVAGLLDDALARATSPDEVGNKKRVEKKKLPRFPLLADDPDAVPSFNYWLKHYDLGFRKLEEWTRDLEREVDAAFPRSFRFALREAAAALGVSPATIYSRLMDVEAALLRRLGQRAPGRKWRRTRRADGPARKPRRRRTKSSIAEDNPDDPWIDISGENAGPECGRTRRSDRLRGRKNEPPLWR